MTAHRTYRRRLLLLWSLLWTQRALRLAVRAAWLFAAGYIIAWFIYEKWQVPLLAERSNWLVAGGALAIPVILAIFLVLPRMPRFAWRIDRTYGLQEQVSGALQAVYRRQDGAVAHELLADASAKLPSIRNRSLVLGWYVLKDVVSLALVLVVGWLLFYRPTPPSPIEVPPVTAEKLAPLGSDPTAADLFPSGVPGLTAADESGGTGSSGVAQEDESPGDYTLSPLAEEALQKLGANLEQYAVSHEMGAALAKPDVAGAAQAAETMGDKMEDTSSDTQQKLASDLAMAGRELGRLEEAQEQGLSKALSDAAAKLAEGDGAQVGAALDQVAAALRAMRGPAGAGGAESDEPSGGAEAASQVRDAHYGEAEPFERIQGVGESFELDSDSALEGSLNGASSRSSQSTVGGLYNRIYIQDTPETVNPMVPYYFSWEWRELVSTYFSP